MHLTLKLRNIKEDHTFIVACNSVDVKANGSGYHIQAISADNAVLNFYVGGPLYDIGYVENYGGATTHVIKPREQHT